jgi:nucleoside-diphosphate-sugar epimerase
MHVLVLGAAGMIGRKLAENLASTLLDGFAVAKMTLADVVPPSAPVGFAGKVETLAVDLAAQGAADALIASQPDLIFHLAAIVSGEAEADLEKGYRVNLDGTRALLDAIRHRHEANGWTPRLVFASSNAVFGGAMPDVIGDDYIVTPQTSYGTQKAMGELLLADYARRGIVTGIGLRLPTICVRPGRPNAAASGFFSGIIREPLVGVEAVLPVPDDTRHWMTSPRSAVGFLRHAATLELARLGDRPNLSMPGLSVTVAEMIAALEQVAGPRAVTLIRRAPDETVARIVGGWARAFDPARALSLGFEAETGFEAIIRAHIEDELGGETHHG